VENTRAGIGINNKKNGCTRMTKRLLNPTFLFATLDFALAALSFGLASALRFQFDIDAATRYVGPLLPRTAAFTILVMLGLLAMGLYRARQRPKHWETPARVIIGVIIGGACYIMIMYLAPDLNSGRGVLAWALALTCFLVSVGRFTLLRFVDQNPVKTRIVVLGTGSNALKIGRLRRASDRRRFEIVGYAASTDEDWKNAERHTELRPVIPTDRVADYPGVEEIVVALDERRGALPIDMLLGLKGRGVPVIDVLDFLERETGKIDLDLLSPSWYVYADASYTNILFRGVKRLQDILLSVLILVLTLPIFACVIAGIWLESGIREPIFYRQNRVGRGKRNFSLLKFRSMAVDAEAASGPQWSSKNDSRVTTVGQLIRRFRIDELPQLFNVLRGEMSVVGPRPERPKFVEMLASEIPMYNVRHNVRPGLTGWAQLNFPYGASVIDAKEKLSYDIFYIKNASVILDLLIFLQTIEVVIWGRAISMAGPPRADGRRGAARIRQPQIDDSPTIASIGPQNLPPVDDEATEQSATTADAETTSLEVPRTAVAENRK